MRTNVGLWWILTAFSFLIGVVYTAWNIIGHPDVPWYTAIEWVGTVALFFAGLMGVMIAFYVDRLHKAQGGELPEDVLTADIDDGDPELGEFSPWSWWPIVLAFSASIAFIGLAVGSWMVPIGFAIFLVAIVGWVYEYYRGYFAR
ncbi:MAG: cytochrome c oxidase subunit IV [Microbacterium sp.]|uniref:cytochrome c oxidase subunit 4 n=1 Tax=Microbacterium TaxID=33882 RepID=UPI000C3DF089|nr:MULTISPECIES: cytochrome c oxidase subunit 4 [Microbacterium]MAB20365.1 cytochrome c oxidase subunit IV [Microbacterium sp.]MAM54743.1 cytochrome c oxidase subunit IV [Microbacterium sp.]MAY48714.1 cytochrome c oxidase subunit IV [Microbacterium sp.]HAS33376.1 cytochrome c oxidase subunit IV [Microbacterium sp.]HBR88362.1 cytochrome c oxidase subunit IV [Microbacterium sp.]